MRVQHVGLVLVLLGVVAFAVVAGILLVHRPVDGPPAPEVADRSSRDAPSPATAVAGPPGVVSGTVRVFRTDEPAPGISVRIEGDAVEETVLTDEAGIFAARVPSGVPLGVRVDAPAPYAPVVLAGVTVEPRRRTSLGTLYLERAFLVTGKVVDRRGRPVAGARVRARRPVREEARRGMFDVVLRLGRERPALEEVIAGENGAFAFRTLSPATYTFEAEAEGFAVGFRPSVIVSPEMRDGAVRIVLGPGASLVGSVKGEGGLPLEDVRVTVLRIEQRTIMDFEFSPVQAVTDGEGEFAFANLTPGRAAIMVTAPGYPVWFDQGTEIGREARIDVVLSGTATLAGRVEDAQGQPVVEAEVLVMLQGGSESGGLGNAKTGEDGEYRIEHLMPGPIQMLVVQKEGYPTWPQNLDFTSMSRGGAVGTLKAGKTLRKDVALGRGTLVTGRVVDASTSRPIAGAEIRVMAQLALMGMGASADAVTDDEGAFRLEGLGMGVHLLVVRAPGFAQPGFDQQALLMQMMGGGGSSDLILKIEEEGGELHREVRLQQAARVIGRVVAPDGKPVPSARISVETDDQFGFAARFMGLMPDPVLAGGDGRFTLGDLPGDKPVRLRAEADGWVAGVSEPVTPSAGQGLEGIEIRLRSPGVVEGTVYGSDGEPVAGASLAAAAFRKDQPWMAEQNLQMAVPVTTDDEGRFRLGGLAPGRNIVRVEADGHVTKRFDEVQVTEGETLTGFDVRLETGLVLEGEVQDESGAPLAGVQVSAHRAAEGQNWVWDPNTTVRTKADGRFRLERLAAEVYRLTCQKDGYIDDTREDVRPGTGALSIRLQKGLVIAGTVWKPDGRAASGVWVHADDGEGNSEGTRTDVEGAFRIEGLGPGTYTVTARPMGDVELRQATQAGVEAGREGLEIRLERGRSISGTVVDADGVPVVGVNVWASGWEGEQVRQHAPTGHGMTDASGAFTVTGLDDGTYRVSAHRDGYQMEQGPVVKSGAQGVRIVLTGAKEGVPIPPEPVPEDDR